MLTKHVAWRERVHADTMALTHSPIPVRGFMCHKDSNGEGLLNYSINLF